MPRRQPLWKGLLKLFILPCSCCCRGLFYHAGCVQPSSRQLAEERRRFAPEPLPKRRKRTLTLPLPPTGLFKPVQTTADQSICSKFFTLPRELRNKIYYEVLGGQKLPVAFRSSTTFFVEMNTRNPVRPKKCLLSLLLSCRQIYSETIDMLYSSNRFVFSHLDNLIYLSSGVLSRRFDLIRSLELQWDCETRIYVRQKGIYYDYENSAHELWLKTWQIIAGMKGLRELCVKISKFMSSQPLNCNVEAALLQPLMSVRGLDLFDVELSWPREPGKVGPEMPGAPFQIRRYDETVNTTDS